MLWVGWLTQWCPAMVQLPWCQPCQQCQPCRPCQPCKRCQVSPLHQSSHPDNPVNAEAAQNCTKILFNSIKIKENRSNDTRWHIVISVRCADFLSSNHMFTQKTNYFIYFLLAQSSMTILPTKWTVLNNGGEKSILWIISSKNMDFISNGTSSL